MPATRPRIIPVMNASRTLLVSLVELAVFQPVFVPVRNAIHAQGTKVIRSILQNGVRKAELPERIDIARLVAMLAGPIFYDALISGATITDRAIARIVDAVLADAHTDGTQKPPRSQWVTCTRPESL